MNTTIDRIILSTLVLISCATKAAEQASSATSRNTCAKVETLKPERKRPLRIASISIILGAQNANKPHEILKKQRDVLLEEMHSSEETVNNLSNSPNPRILTKRQREELRTQKEHHKAVIALCPQEQKAQFVATLRQERKTTKEQFRLQRLDLGDYLKTCCTMADKTRTMAEKALNKLEAIEQTYGRIDQLRQRNNEFAHKIHTLAKRQRRQ